MAAKVINLELLALFFILHHGNLFTQLNQYFTPVARVVKPKKGLREGGIVPATSYLCVTVGCQNDKRHKVVVGAFPWRLLRRARYA